MRLDSRKGEGVAMGGSGDGINRDWSDIGGFASFVRGGSPSPYLTPMTETKGTQTLTQNLFRLRGVPPLCGILGRI